MTTATWTNDRHEAACAATDDVSKATDSALVDALALRMEWLKKLAGEDAQNMRHVVKAILAELVRRNDDKLLEDLRELRGDK